MASSDVLFKGILEPYGDRCSGNILIKSKTVELKTPLGDCKARSYKVVEQGSNGEDQHMTYQIQSKSCGFNVIALSFNHAYPDYWKLKWYKTLGDYKNGNEFLDCPVVRFDK
jgi:hypothetical protein